MFVRLLLLLTLVPIAELYVILKVHGELSERTDPQTALVVTVGSILLTGAVGAALARSQGLGVLKELQRAGAEGRFPGRQLIDGALILVGGALLLTPGYLTDLVGLSFLIPTTRALWRRGMAAWLRQKVEGGRATVRVWSGPTTGRDDWGEGPDDRRIIDVTPDDAGHR